jgi:hypothetical protein
VLYHKNEHDQRLAIVADAIYELRNWEYTLSVVNDPWLLEETRQEACRLNRYELTALVAEVERAVPNSTPARQFAEACNSLIESCCDPQ